MIDQSQTVMHKAAKTMRITEYYISPIYNNNTRHKWYEMEDFTEANFPLETSRRNSCVEKLPCLFSFQVNPQ